MNNHVINPGNHFVIAMKKMSDWEAFPTAPELANRTDG